MAIYLLISLMRIVAMKRMLERIFIIVVSNTSMDPPLIYYQQNTNHELSLRNLHQSSSEIESFPLWAHHSPLFSQIVRGVTVLAVHHAMAVASIGP